MSEFDSENISQTVETDNKLELVRDPQEYENFMCPKRYGRKGVESRKKHIWKGHGKEFQKYGYESFEDVLPDLVSIVEDPESLGTFNKKSGNYILIDSDKKVVVVVRNEPFKKSKRYENITTEPPLPPIIVTAYTLSRPEKADAIIAKHSDNLAQA